MGTFDHSPDPDVDNLQNQDEHDENLPGDGGTLTAKSGVVSVEGEDLRITGDGTLNGADLPGAENHLADNDLLVAMIPVSSDTLANIEHMLDQLTSATDLFDVPAVDLDSATGH